MKKLLAILLFLMPILASAQYITPPCGTDGVMKDLLDRDPAIKKQMEQLENQLQQKLYEEYKKNGNKTLSSGPIYTIPVVVHLIYTNQTDCTPNPLNITDQEIRNAFDHVNASFNARPAGKKYGQARYVSPTSTMYNPDSAGIKFCLATKGYAKGYDPTGTSARTDYPGGAIIRYDGNAAATWANTSNPAGNAGIYVANGVMRSSAGVPETDLPKVGQWPLDKYYNVYLITQLDGNKGGSGTQGFAYFPTGGTTDRAIMLIKDFSNSGNASTFTHEEGHALNLYHPFANNGYAASPTNQDQGGTQAGNCGPIETNHATQGDYVTDTPQCEGSLGINCSSSYDAQLNPCDPNSSPRSVRGDYFHNWMTYGNCANMFTAGQVARMRTTLVTSGTNRFKQVQSANITYCGCDGNNKPAAVIYTANYNPCVGVSALFTDSSLYTPTSRTWTVSPNMAPNTYIYVGGTSSASKYPQLQFNGTGPYTIKLVVQNANGKDSTSITVNPVNTVTAPLVQNFEAATFPPVGWSITNPVDAADVLWSRTTAGNGGFGGSTASAVVQNGINPSTVARNSMYTPAINFSSAAHPSINFSVAYQRYYTQPTDSFIVYYSTDCGATFTRTTYQKGYADLYTSNGASPTPGFVPAPSEWRKETIDFPAAVGKSAVIIKFERGGASDNPSNYLYIDDINIGDQPPVADFIADRTSGCVPMMVNFTDKSTNFPTSWSWDFGDGTALGTTQNPSHNYATAGIYTVKLTATNSGGSNSKTITSYINVLTPASLPFIEGFESATFVPNGWSKTNPVGASDVPWARITGVSGFQNSSACAYLVNGSGYSFAQTNNALTTPPINCSTATNPVLTFSAAYRPAPFGTTIQDSLNVSYSTDCGVTFTSIYKLDQNQIDPGVAPGGSADYLIISGGTNNPFVPTATQWTKHTVSLPVAGLSGVIVKFTRGQITTSGYGAIDNLYLDDINIDNLSLPPTADFSASKTTVCVGEPIVFTDLSTNNPTAWNWTFTGGNPTSSTVKNPTISYTNPGTYSVSLVSTNLAGNSPAATKSAYITVNAAPNASATPGAVNICKGSSTSLKANGGTSYSWNTGETTQTITPTPLSDSTYTVTVTNAATCTASNFATVSVKPVPTAAAGNDTTICPNKSANIGTAGIAGNTYSWTANPSGAALPSNAKITVTPTITTTYTVVATNTSTGCTASSVVTVNVNIAPSPIITPSANPVCGGAPVTLSSSPASAYKWSDATTASSTVVSPSGNTTYKITVTDAKGCTGSASIAIVVNGPVASFTNNNVCLGNPSNFIDTSTGSPVQWDWDFGDASIHSTVQNPSHTYAASGSYSVKLKVTDGSGCFTTVTQTVNIGVAGVLSNFTADKTSICLGDTIHFTDMSTGTPSSWDWNFGDGSAHSTTQNPTYVYTGANTFDVTLTVTNACASNPKTISGYITVKPMPTANAGGSQTTCSNVAVFLGGAPTASGGSGTYSYSWLPTANLDDPTLANPTATLSVSTTYTLVVSDANGCSANAITDVQINGSGTTPTITPSGPTSFCKGGTVDLTASAGTSFAWSSGESTQTITAAPTVTTTYTVTITGSCGNQTVSQVVTVLPSPIASINPVGTVVICSGQSKNLVAPGGAASYLWSTTETGQSISVNTAGSYTVTVTGANGCTAVSPPKSVVVNTAVATITPSGTVTICPGSTTSLTANSGTAYQWSTNQTSKTIIVGTAGTFTVNVTSGVGANACTATSNPVTVVLSSTPKPTITSSKASNNLCIGDSVVLTSSGGGTYLWSPNGETTQSITVKNAANYTVAVNYGSCSRTSDPTSVTFTPAPSVTINASPAGASVCQGDVVTLSVSSNQSISSYNWSNGATTPTITTNASGSYTVTIKSLSQCPSTSAPKVVKVNPLPTPVIHNRGSLAICNGDTTRLYTDPYNSYTWHNGLESTDTINVTKAGSFYVEVVDLNGCKGISPVVKTTLNQLPTAIVTSLPNPANICEGDTVHLTAAFGTDYQYKWSTGIPAKTTQEITVTTMGTYKVTVTDANTCSKVSNAITVTVYTRPIPVITPSSGPSTHFCGGGSVVLSVNAGATYTYQWYVDGQPIPSATNYTYTATASGSYTVRVTNTAGGCNLSKDSSPVVVTVDPQPTANISITGSTFLCSPSDSVVMVVNNSYGTSFQWYIDQNPIANATNAKYVVRLAGIYKVEVTNACGTKTSLPFTVKAYSAIVAKIDTLSPATFCSGRSVNLYAPLGQDYTYQWRKDGFNITGATSQTYRASQTGSYTVVITNPCTSATSGILKVKVLVDPVINNIIPTPSTTTFCKGDSVKLHADITGDYLSVRWLLYNDTIANAKSIDYVVKASGSYTIVVFHACGGSVKQTIALIAKDIPVFTVSPNISSVTICRGTTASFKANTNPTDTITWSTGSHQNVINVNTAGSYFVVVKGANGCSLSSSPISVNVDESVTADFSSSPKPGSNPVEIQFINKSFAGVNYNWNFADHTPNSNVENPTHPYAIAGTYAVKLIVKNPSSQCTDSITKDVVVNQTGNIMPNVFTPNDDGKNDFFKLSDDLKDYQFIKGEIFDRWGKKIYEWDSSNSKVGWNGKSVNGEDEADGVYFYIVRMRIPVIGASGVIIRYTEYNEKGSVTLFRNNK
jgi:gliding motility-associated-like protein